MDNRTKITKVEITALWKRFDLIWNLHEDVNILSGINGSGKSTILNCIALLITEMALKGHYRTLLDKIEITLDTENIIIFEKKDALSSTMDEIFLHRKGGHSFSKMNRPTAFNIFNININIISTFDKAITEVGNRPDENVRTVLDKDIFKLQKQYLDFQLNISKTIVEALKKNLPQTEILQIRARQERFLEIMDTLFKDTDKKINRDKNEITFLNGEEEISAYQLSSGEKQILVILLTTLVQNNKPSIIFMDEPEISLHFDWQKKLIQYIRELNPNAQIILATHSPAIVMEGWHDKVFDVRDLITNDRLKNKQ